MKANNINVDDKQQIQNYYFPSDLEGAWLENVIKEIWEDKEYERFGIKVNSDDIVLDLGSSVGVFSLYALNKKAHQIYAFESNDKVASLSVSTDAVNSTSQKYKERFLIEFT